MATSHEARPARGLSVSKRAFHVPADNLADAVRLCDPFSPLDPREDEVLHEDLSAILGGDRLGKIVRNIRRAGGTPTLHFLSGHLGSGKTTELLRMNNRFPDDCNRRSRPTGPRRKLAARDRRALACWRPGLRRSCSRRPRAGERGGSRARRALASPERSVGPSRNVPAPGGR